MTKKGLRELNEKLFAENDHLEKRNEDIVNELVKKDRIIKGYETWSGIVFDFCKNNVIRYLLEDEVIVYNNVNINQLLYILKSPSHYNVSLWFIVNTESFYVIKNGKLEEQELYRYKNFIEKLEGKEGTNE